MTSKAAVALLPSRSAPDAGEEVGEALWDLFRVISIRGQAECRELGLTLAQGKLLIMLGAQSSWEPSTLARKLDLSRQAMSSAVNHLEHEGLVTRLHSPTDHRRVFVELTRRGRVLHGKLQTGHHRMHRQINRLFSGSDRERAVEILAAIRRELAGTLEPLPYRCQFCAPASGSPSRGA